MSELNILFVTIGAVAFAVGIAMLVRAVRGRPGEDARATAMLIAGMMAAAFGLLMAGFAISYATAEGSQ